jgi:hypothetical protein
MQTFLIFKLLKSILKLHIKTTRNIRIELILRLFKQTEKNNT